MPPVTPNPPSAQRVSPPRLPRLDQLTTHSNSPPFVAENHIRYFGANPYVVRDGQVSALAPSSPLYPAAAVFGANAAGPVQPQISAGMSAAAAATRDPLMGEALGASAARHRVNSGGPALGAADRAEVDRAVSKKMEASRNPKPLPEAAFWTRNSPGGLMRRASQAYKDWTGRETIWDARRREGEQADARKAVAKDVASWRAPSRGPISPTERSRPNMSGGGQGLPGVTQNVNNMGSTLRDSSGQGYASIPDSGDAPTQSLAPRTLPQSRAAQGLAPKMLPKAQATQPVARKPASTTGGASLAPKVRPPAGAQNVRSKWPTAGSSGMAPGQARAFGPGHPAPAPAGPFDPKTLIRGQSFIPKRRYT